MEELSWRARLARSNINILNIDEQRWYYEFMYHPRYGQTKWCKTFLEAPLGRDPEYVATELEREVLTLRKELERDE